MLKKKNKKRRRRKKMKRKKNKERMGRGRREVEGEEEEEGNEEEEGEEKEEKLLHHIENTVKMEAVTSSETVITYLSNYAEPHLRGLRSKYSSPWAHQILFVR
jgi:hypothetical protein